MGYLSFRWVFQATPQKTCLTPQATTKTLHGNPKPWKMKVLNPQYMGYNPYKLSFWVPMAGMNFSPHRQKKPTPSAAGLRDLKSRDAMVETMIITARSGKVRAHALKLMLPYFLGWEMVSKVHGGWKEVTNFPKIFTVGWWVMICGEKHTDPHWKKLTCWTRQSWRSGSDVFPFSFGWFF